MAHSTPAPVHPKLVIHMVLRDSVASYFILKLLEVRGGPTFTVKKRDVVLGGYDCWMSKRTYDDMKRILAEAREDGEWDE